jgi:hypothetical protein
MAKRKPAATLSDQFRERILQDGRPLSELARAAGINRVILWRFVYRDRGINLTTADRLAEVLRLRLADDR